MCWTHHRAKTCSASNSSRLATYRRGWLQKLPTYTRVTWVHVNSITSMQKFFYLRVAQDFWQRPHQRTIDPHQLLVGHHVRLVQDDPDLVVLRADRFDGVLELVRDVKLVCVEDQDNSEGRTVLQLWSRKSLFFHLSAFSANHLRTPVKS